MNENLKLNQEHQMMYVKTEILKSLLKINEAQADVKKNLISQPTPSALVVTTATESFANPVFLNQYDRYNCTADPALRCLKIKICIRPSGCLTDAVKIIQTYVFTLAPTTLLRD